MRTNEPEQKPFMPDPSYMDITDEKFQDLTDITVKMVEETELGKSKDMAPMLMVRFREFDDKFMPSDIQGAVIVVAGGFDPDTKQDILRSIGRMHFEKRWFPVAVFMISEAWMSSITQEDYDKQGGVSVMPSQDPNRKECIMIAGRTTNGDCKVGVNIPIVHDKDGIMIRDGENMVTKELEMYLLNEFFWGFFEKVAGKGNDDEDVRPGPGPSGR
jgi:hypothetical protein